MIEAWRVNETNYPYSSGAQIYLQYYSNIIASSRIRYMNSRVAGKRRIPQISAFFQRICRITNLWGTYGYLQYEKNENCSLPKKMAIFHVFWVQIDIDYFSVLYYYKSYSRIFSSPTQQSALFMHSGQRFNSLVVGSELPHNGHSFFVVSSFLRRNISFFGNISRW